MSKKGKHKEKSKDLSKKGKKLRKRQLIKMR